MGGFEPTLGGRRPNSTSNVCKTTLENLGPMGAQSVNPRYEQKSAQ
jgi:hypothetical protein